MFLSSQEPSLRAEKEKKKISLYKLSDKWILVKPIDYSKTDSEFIRMEGRQETGDTDGDDWWMAGSDKVSKHASIACR